VSLGDKKEMPNVVDYLIAGQARSRLALMAPIAAKKSRRSVLRGYIMFGDVEKSLMDLQ